MLGDAELVPPNDSPCLPLEVPGVGTVSARRPRPNAVPLLAMSVNPDIPIDPDVDDGLDAETKANKARDHYLSLFVRTHLDDGEHERVLAAMMTDDAPADSMGKMARALATWGTARPYVAVMSLSLMAATHWRGLRTRYQGDGIANPMAELPSMHSLLDYAERIWLEALHSGNEDKDRHDREQLFDRLYAPEPTGAKGLNAKDYKPTVRPAGFDPDEVEADFSAAFRALGAR